MIMVDSLGIGIELYKKEKKMGRIYVTGDIHSEPDRFNTENFPEQKEMTRDDYVIICGDFGLVWSEDWESKRETWWLDWLENKTYTTLFVDGNHENFTRLNSLPIEEWHGGRVHKIREHVIHLMRGEMFDLDGKMIFTFGGARSHDIDGFATNSALKKDYTAGILQPDDPLIYEKLKILRTTNCCARIEEVSWWRSEMPTRLEMLHGLETLKAHNWKTDFIFSHDGPSSSLEILGGGLLSPDPLNQYLEKVKKKTSYNKWFFGHHHVDRQITEKDSVIYEQITRIC